MKKLFRISFAAITFSAALLLAVACGQVGSQEISLTSKTRVHQTELSGTPEKGVLKRFTVKLPEYTEAMVYGSTKTDFNSTNRLYPWPMHKVTELLDHPNQLMPEMGYPDNLPILMVLHLADGSYSLIQPLATADAMSWIEVVDDQTIELVCGTMGTDAVEVKNFPACVSGNDTDLYRLFSDAWKAAIKHKDIQISLRSERNYPEPFKYLGWCSWEHFKKGITADNLVGAIGKLETSEVPVRWALIDDGHQAQESMRLVNFGYNTKKFPQGMAPVNAMHSDKIRWIGLWHCMNGLWNGISPKNDMTDIQPYLDTMPNRTLMPDGSREAAEAFYGKMVSECRKSGFDFMKVDGQTGTFYNRTRTANPVQSHRYSSEALERNCQEQMSGLMNCMAMNLPCMMGMTRSATVRVSIDYALNNTPKLRTHIYQGFQNTPWIGQFLYPDHDMFHSSDVRYGQLMAISKALSMAPIYLSDYPTDFKPEYILPLCDPEGKLYRPLAPGAPLPSSYFANVVQEENAYQVIAPLSGNAAAIASYNLCDNASSVIEVTLTPEDYASADIMMQPYRGDRDLPAEGLVYYDWYKGQGGVLKDGYTFKMENMTDSFVILSEIEKGWSVIGDTSKYLSPVTVKSSRAFAKELRIEMEAPCSFLIYSKSPVTSCDGAQFEAVGDAWYRITLDPEETSCTVRR